ncbi:OTU domain-containing protein 5 isoform X2 [Vigna radiata var. radiata]|uniref:OTU domain-containing protein 5 isoform X2 n=1 Tax=Vigna radiata var. radiata TaxID=3916 RepID=A0A3Q0ERH6_VIGRR|nr:OTU domain-containing protein 5 isoform X2 [Vigna radiata var. radiata]
MTRVLVQRGSSGGGSSSNANRSGGSSTNPSARAEAQVLVSPDNTDEVVVGDDVLESDDKGKSEESIHFEQPDGSCDNGVTTATAVVESDIREEFVKGLSGLRIGERNVAVSEGASGDSSSLPVGGGSCPPPPPVPPPKPNLNARRSVAGSLISASVGSSRRTSAWPAVPARTSPAGSRPSSPRSHNESEGYNSADEQKPCLVSSYDDFERERQFEIDIRRAKGYEVKKMMEDGNCLFRAVADQVYGDSEVYDLVRQMCIDYMWFYLQEQERDHFSQFITEGFTSYCKRKRRDKVYGNNVEIQAMCEMYNRPIHIYSYSIEPINIFHGSYNTDTPPIRLSYHHGNHYNSLVDPRRSAIGAGLGFSSLRGTNVDKDQVKDAIKSQQDEQINNALLAEGRFYSDLELTEKEIERMVIEVSRAEYLSDTSTFKQQLGDRESSTSNAEPSSSGARPSGTGRKTEDGKEHGCDLSSGMQILLSMGFTYIQAIEAYSIFGDDVDSMVCYLLETGSSSRRKGKATE